MALRTNKLFWAIVLDGALLTACGNPDIDTDESGQGDTEADTDTDEEEACPADCLAEDYSTTGEDSWESCYPDTDVCCWTVGECCDLCCENW